MPTGKIKRLMKDRGFGFIRGNDGQEVFFHRQLTQADLRLQAEQQKNRTLKGA